MSEKAQDEPDWSAAGPGTVSVWAGERGFGAGHPVHTPIVTSVTHGFPDVESWLKVARGEQAGHIYARSSNPTVSVFEEKVRLLEGANAALAFASGMAAISDTLHALLTPGDRVVTVRDSYGGTSKIFLEILPRWGIDVEICDTDDVERLESSIRRGCRLVYLESPTNPTLKILDLRRLASAAQEAGATVIVDNTFATPINQRPLALGADLVIHSATKFLGGHSDALGGVLCGPAGLIRQVFTRREVTGAALDAFSAYLLIRGIKTLEVRVERQNANAHSVAAFLRRHPAVEEVFYPGLESHPSHRVACGQMRGFGGVLSFSLRGGHEAVVRLLSRLRLAHLAASLGSVATLAGPPATTSHVELSAAQRSALGIPEGLVRYSVGIENCADLIADLERALEGL